MGKGTPFAGTQAVGAGRTHQRPKTAPAVSAIDSLARATGLGVAEVQPLIQDHRGARGMKQLRRVLALVDAGAESPQETRTRLAIIFAGLPRPQTQIPVRNDWGAVVARIDMGWEQWRVGVEYDGAQHWTDSRIHANDIDRIAELVRRGWRIVRVSADLLRNRPDVLIARIHEALRAAGCPC